MTDTQVLKALLTPKQFCEVQIATGEDNPTIADFVKAYRNQRLQGKRYAALIQFVNVAARPIDNSGIVDDPSVAANVLMPDLSFQAQEKFAVVVLDVKHHILGKEIISIGTATECLAHPREIMQAVLKHGGSRFIIAHNHPSGSLEPSSDDMHLTRQILKAAHVMGIPCLDHLIIGNAAFASLREQTSLWQELPQE